MGTPSSSEIRYEFTPWDGTPGKPFDDYETALLNAGSRSDDRGWSLSDHLLAHRTKAPPADRPFRSAPQVSRQRQPSGNGRRSHTKSSPCTSSIKITRRGPTDSGSLLLGTPLDPQDALDQRELRHGPTGCAAVVVAPLRRHARADARRRYRESAAIDLNKILTLGSRLLPVRQGHQLQGGTEHGVDDHPHGEDFLQRAAPAHDRAAHGESSCSLFRDAIASRKSAALQVLQGSMSAARCTRWTRVCTRALYRLSRGRSAAYLHS